MDTFTLPNGLRIIHLPVDSPVAYCGYAVNAGSRDEEKNEYGLAHFVEHTLFKGTLHRKSRHILNRMENVGGELNAYTSKESTFVYSSFLAKDMERAVELLTDLAVNSQFPEKEIDKEREVVLDEIQTYEDTPSDLIFDDFDNMIFEGHPLGHHILGDRRSLKSFKTATGKSFLDRYYTADNMVFFTMSSHDFKYIRRLAEKYISAVPAHKSAIKRIEPHAVASVAQTKKKKTHLSHVVIGGQAFNMYDERRFHLFLLNNILGGPGMNNRLNISLREKHGLVYTVESSIVSYTDCGIFSIYFGTDHKHCDFAVSLVEKELKALRDTKLTDLQIAAAKKQAIGQLGVASDSRENTFLGLGKSFLYHNRYMLLPEIFRNIEAVTPSQILEAANAVFHPDRLSRLVFE